MSTLTWEIKVRPKEEVKIGSNLEHSELRVEDSGKYFTSTFLNLLVSRCTGTTTANFSSHNNNLRSLIIVIMKWVKSELVFMAKTTWGTGSYS